MDLNCVEGFNNLGMKRVSFLVQRHVPTSSIEDGPTSPNLLKIVKCRIVFPTIVMIALMARVAF
jgi:hypothetical protein